MKPLRPSLSFFILSLCAILPASAAVELVAGFNFGQFIGGGYPSTDGLNGSAVGEIASNFARDEAPTFMDGGVYRVANGIEASFSAGAARLYFDGSRGSQAWDFSGGSDVSVVERGSLVAVNHELVNGRQMFVGDQNNAALRFTATGGATDFALVADTLGWSDFDPAAFAQPNDANFTFSAYAASGSAASVQWLLDGVAIGAPITVAPGEFQAFQLDLPATFYGKTGATLIGRVAGDLVLDNVQINGVRAAAAGFVLQPVGRTVVAGATVQFTVEVSGAAAPTYRWRRNGTDLVDGAGIAGATTATLTLTGVTPARAGDYTVVVNNNGASAESAAATLVVQVAPAITEQPSAASANPGESIVFDVSASGSPAPAYQWRRNGLDLADDGRITGATTATLAISALTAADEGDYTVVITNAAGLVVSSPAALTITDATEAPNIQQQPVSAAVNAGQTATFRVNATGTPVPAYRWRFNGAPLIDGPGVAGSATPTLRITPASLAAAGDYTVLVSNSAGEVESSVAVLTVFVPPSIPEGSAPRGGAATVGGSFVFRIAAAGTPAPTFQWFKNGEPLVGQTGAELVINPVEAASAGDYSVVVTNSAGSVESPSATLVVNQVPVITTQPLPLALGAGTTATFRVVASGSPAPAYQWFKDGEAISDAVESSLVIDDVRPADAGAYSVVVSNAAGSVASDLARLEVAVRVVRVTGTQAFAPVTRISLDSNFAPDSGFRFQWLRDGKAIAGATGSTLAIPSAAFSDSATYSVRIYSAAGRLLRTIKIAAVRITVAGSYDALVRDPVTGEPVARINITVAQKGSFTGSLLHEDGKTYGFKGQLAFGTGGDAASASGTIKRASTLAAFSYALALDVQERVFTFTLGSGETVLGVAEEKARAASGEVVAWAGAYALSFAPLPGEAAGQPTSTAVLKSVVARKGGAMKITGVLVDKTKVTANVPSSVSADFAVWLSLYSGKGHLAGDLRLTEITAGNYAADRASSGEFFWFRPADPKSKVFPGGIDLRLAPTLMHP